MIYIQRGALVVRRDWKSRDLCGACPSTCLVEGKEM
jgi:hypothetical protein